MANWRVIYTTYEEYDVEAETKEEALVIADKQFRNDRYSPIANTWYDEVEVEYLDKDES